MKRNFTLFFLVAVLSVFPILGATAQDATPIPSIGGEDSLLADYGYPVIHVTTDGVTHDFPAEVEAGRYHVILENQSELGVDLEFIQLPEGVTADDVNAAFDEAGADESPMFIPPDFFFDMTWNGGPGTLPGATYGVVLDLTPGEWYLNLYTFDPETEEETDTQSTVTVTGEMPAVEETAGVVEIGLIDMDFRVPDTLTAGPQVWKVENNGLQIHHMVFSRVPDDTTEDQVMELAGMFFGPQASPAAEPALSFEDVEDVFFTLLFSNGQFNLYEINLEPGTYAMICFMPDPSGTPHVMLGMVEIVVVE